jgi:hypothetical protein
MKKRIVSKRIEYKLCDIIDSNLEHIYRTH